MFLADAEMLLTFSCTVSTIVAPNRLIDQDGLGGGYNKKVLEEFLPKFFFDMDDGSKVYDRIGIILENPLDVKAEAVTRAAIYAAKPLGLKDGWALQISVRDQNDVVVMHVRMACQVDFIAS